MTRLATMIQQRRLQTGKRRKPRRVLRPVQPRGIEAAYAGLVREVLAVVDAAVLGAVGESAEVRADAMAPWLETAVERAARRALLALRPDALRARLEALAKRTSQWSKDQLKRQLHSALGVDPLMLEPNVQAQIAAWIDQGVDRIRSLSEAHVERVRRVLHDAPLGTSPRDLVSRIREVTIATPAQARTIARTEISTLQATVMQARHERLGITSYIWSTSGDARVRPSHAALNGQEFSYNDPPVTSEDGRRNNPGQDFSCRCVAIPVIPVDQA